MVIQCRVKWMHYLLMSTHAHTYICVFVLLLHKMLSLLLILTSHSSVKQINKNNSVKWIQWWYKPSTIPHIFPLTVIWLPLTFSLLFFGYASHFTVILCPNSTLVLWLKLSFWISDAFRTRLTCIWFNLNDFLVHRLFRCTCRKTIE